VFAAPLVASSLRVFKQTQANLTHRSPDANNDAFHLLVALAAQAMGVLNARDRFGIPALSSSFFNVGSIIGGVSVAALLTDPTLSPPDR